MQAQAKLSSRKARTVLHATAGTLMQQGDMLIRMGSVVNDHAEHIQAIEDERARLKGLRARLRWLLTGQ